MEVSATGGAFTSMKGDSGQQNGETDNNNLPQTTAILASKQTSLASDSQHQPQTNYHNSISYRDEVNAILDTVLTRIVGELSLTQDAGSQQASTNKFNMEDATNKQSNLSPSLSPDDATCDLVIDSASNSADNQDSETQEAPVSMGGEEQQASLSNEADTHTNTTNLNQQSVILPNSVLMQTYQPLIQSTNLLPVNNETQDEDEDKIKDIVTLRNLEVTPPPTIPTPPAVTCETANPPPTTSNSTTTQLETAEATTKHEEQGSRVDFKASKQDNYKNIDIRQSETEQVATREPKTVKEPAVNRKRARASDTRSDTTISGGALDESLESSSSSRSKRQRTQTRLFQVGDLSSPSYCDSPAPSTSSSAKSKSSSSARKTVRDKKRSSTTASATASTTNTSKSAQPPSTPPSLPPQSPPPKPIPQHTNDLQGVIFYEKNDILAIRNEENSFYLCQLTENVRVTKPMIRVKWLDTKDNKNYFLTALYDHVPQLSILMPVNLTKLKQEHKGEQMFALSNQDRDNILDRLKRSLNASAINQSSSNATS